MLHEGLGDSKYRPCPLLVNYVNAGYLGKKTGRGFYNYSKWYLNLNKTCIWNFNNLVFQFLLMLLLYVL